uniref:Uncharacterized protein n=1 Tax=Caenorhabditis tropicalis TaxID=1561998 RepID=A0A1I7UNP3_9PELO
MIYLNLNPRSSGFSILSENTFHYYSFINKTGNKELEKRFATNLPNTNVSFLLLLSADIIKFIIHRLQRHRHA